MTGTSQVAAAQASPGSGVHEAPPTNPSATLGQNDFLKLMIAQLQAQDPLSPANTNEYLSELAQFTQVEQTTNLANSSELTGAVQLLGHTVTYNGPQGQLVTGKVEGVQTTSAGTTVTVEGKPGIKLSSVVEVH